MIRQYIISILLWLSLAGCDVDPEEAKRNAHHPSDGIAAFVDGCILPNGSEEHTRAVFAKHNVTYDFVEKVSGRFPSGDFFKKTGINLIDSLYWNSGFQTRCTVRIRGLWVDDALDPVTKRLAEQGFRKVKSITVSYTTYYGPILSSRSSPVTGIYQHGQKLFFVSVAEATQKAGRITDLNFGLVE